MKASGVKGEGCEKAESERVGMRGISLDLTVSRRLEASFTLCLLEVSLERVRE